MLKSKRTTLFTSILAVSLALSGGACGLKGPSALNPGGGDGGVGPGTDSVGSGFNPSSGAGGSEGDECATSEADATLIPVNMFIAVDKSGSMDDDNKWNDAKSAFTDFFLSDDADSLNVALRFWPDGGGCPAPENCSCNTASYAVPHVELGSLAETTHEVDLVDEFNDNSPGGYTPMSAALAGATSWAQNHQVANEGKEKTVVILLTDGEPTACDTEITNIATIAGDAFNQDEILTFAVGLAGSFQDQMNAIAQAGGTDTGIFINSGDTEAELLAALKAIQESAVACTFAMPESDDPNQVVDPSRVNVTYTPGGGGEAQTLPQVDGPESCAEHGGGWYYDDPDNPAIIELCDETCNEVQLDENAAIRIVLGCMTYTP